MNKEGQEGLSLGTLLMIILGVVVLVVLVLGFTGAFDFIFRQTDQLPQALESAVQGCRVAAQGSLTTSYCYQFREIGNDQYINCQDSRVQEALRNEDVNIPQISCESLNNEITRFCNTIDEDDRAKVRIIADSTYSCPEVSDGTTNQDNGAAGEDAFRS